jgi:REP element-mobilizing transposase RayT
MRTKQTSFFPKLHRIAHGHGLRKGKRKEARPFHPKLPLHVVWRSTHAKGKLSFLTPKNRDQIEKLLKLYAKLYRIKIYRFQNVGNHLHLLIKTEMNARIEAKKDLNKFMRRLTGEIAMKVTGAKKCAAFQKGAERFWDELVYSRIVSFGADFKNVVKYFIKNLFEAHGVWNRKKFPEWELRTIEAESG